MATNEDLMHQALDVARGALASNDVPIGAIVIDPNGKVIGIGANRREIDEDPSAHAEICAMCAGAIAQSRVKTLIFGAWDEKAGAVGSVWDILRDPRSPHRTEVISGVLEKECAEILAQFFKTQRDH